MASQNEIGSKPVRVSIPASVAADIGTYKKAIGSILDRLGCPSCCSGHDIFFELQRDIVLPNSVNDATHVAVAPKVEIRTLGAQNTLRVGIQPKLADSIENVFAALERFADISGHPACATGCDMFFQLESNYVLDSSLNVREQVISVANRTGI